MITLATLPDATPQQVFEQVAKHLLKQGEKSANHNGCRYLQQKKDGTVLRCAAGCLIAEEEYNPEMEILTWSRLKFHKLVPEEHSELIGQLQGLHDEHDSDSWPAQLKKLAATFGLDASFIGKEASA